MAESDRIHATYWLETGDDPQRAAEAIAGEQSSGTFLKLVNETQALRERAGARVELLVPIDEAEHPSLPTPAHRGSGADLSAVANANAVSTGGAGAVPARFRRCLLELSWPLANIGPSLPNLLATVGGNLFELRQVTGLRVLDLKLPSAFAAAYPGPAFGVVGTRRLSGVAQGPLIGTIIKPSVGLSAEETAREVRSLVRGGIDFIKDDELQADGPGCPFEDRLAAVMREVLDGEQRTGRRAMVAFNITGELDEMKRRHDQVLAAGGTCVMLSMHAVGLVGLAALRRHAVLPIHAHRNGWGALSRCPALGWDYAPWQQLWRLAGADHLHVNGLANKFSESDASVIAAARAVTRPLFDAAPMAAMPVFSSGQTGLVAAATYAALGHTDLIFAAGGGIFGHPQGVAAGVSALRQAWDAAVGGVSLQAHAHAHPELRAALGFW